MSSESNNETDAKSFLSQGQGDRFDRWIEFLSVIVLSLATIMTAWCGYQAAQWDGEQANYYNLATTAQVAASQKANEGVIQTSTEIGLFVEYAAAISTDNTELADFFFNRFPPTLRAATNAWLAQNPLQNPEAPLTPFDMDEYVVEEQIESEELQAESVALFHKANEANELSDEYILLTVLFATVLFLTGIAGKFQWRVLDAAMLIMGTCVFVYGAIRIVNSPIL